MNTGIPCSAQFAQDYEDHQQARILALIPMNTSDSLKTFEQRSTDALIKIRADRIERQTAHDAGRAYALARQRGIDSVTPAETSSIFVAIAATPAPVGAVGASGSVKPDKDEPAKPLQRTAAQDSAILCEIEKQGYDPLALPKNPPGKSGAKAAIRAALSKNSLFTGATVFDKAWERLTAHADISIQG